MTAATEEAPAQGDALQLRASPMLTQVPPPAIEAAAQPAEPPPQAQPAPPPAPAPAIATANAQAAQAPGTAPPAAMGVRSGGNATSWGLAGLGLLACAGWLYERRKRRLMETEKDSVMWAHIQPPNSSVVTTANGLDDILPDGPDPAEAARAIYVTAIGETSSRREATLIDLHQLEDKLVRRRARGDTVAAVLLLQQHLVDFRFTSPWVFLELLELYKVLGREREWEVTRDAFRARFGQNAPLWSTPSTDHMELAADPQLMAELMPIWPFRAARMCILRWMLGEHEMRHKASGPPLLGLGIYRDLMFLDTVLDVMMITKPAPVDSLL